MKKEILIFFSIFLVLSFFMHQEEWLTYPLEHLKNLQNAGAYGFGSLHIIFFPAIIYLIITLPRFLLRLIKRK